MEDRPEEVEVELFYCNTCDAGWFGTKEKTRTRNIYDFHNDLGHDLITKMEWKSKKFWGHLA